MAEVVMNTATNPAVNIPTLPMPESKEYIELEKRFKKYSFWAKISIILCPPAFIWLALSSYMLKKRSLELSSIGSRANVNCPHCKKELEFTINSNYIILTCDICKNKFYVKK